MKYIPSPEQVEAIKNEWLPALRSGEYTQGTGRLVSTIRVPVDDEVVDLPTYCCLGVACEVKNIPRHPENHDMFVFKRPGNLKRTNDSDTIAMSSVPPKAWMVENFGIHAGGDFIDENGVSRSLTALNDEGESFDYIADLIERLIDPNEQVGFIDPN